jgi:N-methylhydantoinase A/oxoprolinase/acetone carboxylase beta subunit
MREIQILGIDAGGTMTDTIIIDGSGEMVIGKAATTPHDESIGFISSLKDALNYWELNLKNSVNALDVSIYSGTAMINTLIQRKGKKVGLLITKGLEDYLLMERGVQTYLGYHYPDRLHSVTHVHNPPLVPRRWVKGIGGRVDMFGNEVIPLYEDEVRAAARELIDEGVEAICVSYTFSYVNPAHEARTEEIIKEVMKEAGLDLPIYLGSIVQPVMREYSRLNCVIIEAYAADPSRKHLLKIEEEMKKEGFIRQLQIMTAHGGVVNVRTAKAFQSLISGPIGGIVGSRYVADSLGIKNVICTDMGGTSFDVGLITEGVYALNPEPDIARFKINLPMVAVDSIGAGTGTYIKIDPISNRVELGPESAGADPGPVCYGIQKENPTICDCDVICGIINPEYYLGGSVTIHKELAEKVFKEKVADPLGLDVYEAAAGMIDLVETQMRDHLHAMVLGRGFETYEYYLSSYGGAGPMHVANYSSGLNFRGIMIPSWAPAFSAFGCTCADYQHRADKSTLVMFPLGVDDNTKVILASQLNALWEDLKQSLIKEFAGEGYTEEKIRFTPYVRMSYTGQLDSLEVECPTRTITTGEEVDTIIENFENLYEKVFARAAKFPEAGYLVSEAVLTASVETIKPAVTKQKLENKKPDKKSQKGMRDVYWDGTWKPFSLFEMDLLAPGNVVDGPAIVEHPATTLVVPPDYRVSMDEYKIFWMES